MKIECEINQIPRQLYIRPHETAQEVLKREGFISVRNSDDGEGFAGSDTILINAKPMYSTLILAASLEGKKITTAESLSKNRKLSVVQQAMIDAGVVQSGYNSPAAALILTELLTRIPKPTKEDIKDSLSGLFNRATGYQQFYKAVEIASNRLINDSYKTEIAPEFREDLRIVGKVAEKVDGKKLVAGYKAFVEDMVESGTYILKMLRSPYAHAYINTIDCSEAEKIPGVLLILHYKNCPDTYYGQAGQGFPEPSPYDRRMFNKKLRHVGDRVAAVIAESEEIALRAIELIQVNYEILSPVLTLDDAIAEDAPIIHNGYVEYVSGAPSNLQEYNATSDIRDGKVIYQFPIHADPKKNIAAGAHGFIGNVDKGFLEADITIERTYETSQIQCTPLETHIVYTKMDGDRLIVHASTQVPWHLRRILSAACSLSENKIRIIKERVGGGYGSKQDILIEDVAAYATCITGKPVLFHYSREEEFISNSTRHPMRITMKVGAKKDGTITAIYMNVLANTGPYGNHCLTVPMNACSKSLPLINCPNMKFDVTTYYTNIPPTGAYQGYGAPKGSFALMTALAELADVLQIDYLKLIEKNRVDTGTMLEILRCLGEGREGVPVRIQSCGLSESIQVGSDLISWGKIEQSDNPDIKIGKGFAIIQQGSGLPGLDHSCADISLLSDGTFMLHSGGADLGTGLDTVSVKLAAEVLCVDMNDIAILSGDTDNTPFDTGAYASSGTFFSGNASKKAAEDLRKKILIAAQAELGEPIEDLHLEYPGYVVSYKTENKLSLKNLAHSVLTGTGRGQLTGFASFTTDDAAFPYGAHFCQVAVNIKTGEIIVQKYYALQDCGTPINPELAMGQIYGGVLKSIGHTLYEQLILDENGICLNANLRDYGVPMISEVPEDFRTVLIYTQDAFGPFGGKSVSEISTNGAAPAIASAIHDAVGVWMRTWPFTPEKILRAMGKF